MAKIFGGPEAYVLNGEKSRRLFTNKGWWFVVFFSLLIGGVVYKILADPAEPFSHKIIRFFIYSLVFFAICCYLLILYSSRKLTELRLFSNIRYEEKVYDELKVLPDKYVIFWDVFMGSGSVNFSVLRHDAVFMIRLKTEAGKIDYKNFYLLINGKHNKNGDFLGQAYEEAQRLKRYIFEKTKLEVDPIPLLVFTSSGAKINLPDNDPPRGVYVLNLKNLKDFLLSYPIGPGMLNVPVLVNFFKNAVSSESRVKTPPI